MCGLVSANSRDNKLLHSTWSISLRLKRPGLLLGEFGRQFFYSFANATAAAAPAPQLTLSSILCQSCRAIVLSCNALAHSTHGFPDRQSASAVQTCISCKFLKWLSFISAQLCAVSAERHSTWFYTIQAHWTFRWTLPNGKWIFSIYQMMEKIHLPVDGNSQGGM